MHQDFGVNGIAATGLFQPQDFFVTFMFYFHFSTYVALKLQMCSIRRIWIIKLSITYYACLDILHSRPKYIFQNGHDMGYIDFDKKNMFVHNSLKVTYPDNTLNLTVGSKGSSYGTFNQV